MLSFSSSLSLIQELKILFVMVKEGGVMYKLDTFHVIAHSYMAIFDLDKSVLYFLFSTSMAEN